MCLFVCVRVLAFVKDHKKKEKKRREKKSIKGKTVFAESGGVLKRQKGCAAVGGCGRS